MITNIVSTSGIIVKGYGVTMDSVRENCFFVIDKKNGTIKFTYDKRGLYVRSDEPLVDCCKYYFNISVEGFTKREVERAIAAWKFYHDANAENVQNMKNFVQSNQAKDVLI